MFVKHVEICRATGWKSRCECCASGCESWWAMLRQWLWIMMRCAESVVENHVVIYWASRWESRCEHCASKCEPWWYMLRHWLWITMCYAEPVAVIHCALCWASCCETFWFILRYWLWIIVGNAEAVVASHCVLCWAWCVGIMVCYAKPVVVNHCAMLSRVSGNHGVLFWASGWYSRCEWCSSGCESWWVMLSQWLWITICYSVPVG